MIGLGPNNKKLKKKFFSSCRLECGLARAEAEVGCVPWALPRGPGTKVDHVVDDSVKGRLLRKKHPVAQFQFDSFL